MLLLVGGLLLVHFATAFGPVAELPWLAFVGFPVLLPITAFAAGRLSALNWRSRTARLLRLLQPILPLVGFAALTQLTPWARVARQAVAPWCGPEQLDWPDIGQLATLAPLVIAHWLACSVPPSFRARSLFTRTNVRVAQFALVWTIAATLLTLSTAIGASPWLRIRLEESTLLSLGLSLVALVVTLALMPRALLFFLRTEPIEGHHRRLAEGVAEHLGIAAPRLFLWRTDDELRNALVVSTMGPRPVLFTDAFLAHLSMDEFRAVVAHELGHVAGRHVSLMGSLVLGATLVLEVIAAPWLDGEYGIVVAGVFLGAMLLLVGFVSRRVELEADWYALSATRDPGALAEALVRASGGRLEQRGWRHFSVVQRLTFWRAAQHDPGVIQRLRRVLARFRRSGAVLLALGLALTVYHGLVAHPAESFVIHVREQRLNQAAQALTDLAPSDFERAGYREYAQPVRFAELVRITTFGAHLQARGEALDVRSLGEQAQAVLAQADGPHAVSHVQEARALLDLALLIGAPESAPLARAVRAGGGFDPSIELPGAWADVARQLDDARERDATE